MNKYLITGANGFVGSALMSKLGNQAIGAVRTAQSTSHENTKVIGDINSTTNWNDCLENVDTVVHLAGIAHKRGITHQEYDEVNHLGTLKLAEDAAKSGIKRFVFMSTIGVLGSAGKFSDSSLPNPHNDYSRSKNDAENGLRQIAERTGMELVIIRPPLVYGKNAPGNFGLLCTIVNKLPALPFGSTHNRRSFISTENLIDLVITCSNHRNAIGQVFLAKESRPISTKVFTNAIAKGLGKKVIQIPVPPVVMKILLRLVGRTNLYSQLFGNLEINSDKLEEVLDWKPKHLMEEVMTSLKAENKK